MEIRTEGGISQSFPLSDIQEYNKRLDKHSNILKMGIIIGSFLGMWALILITFLVWKVLHTGAVNTYIARCVC